MKLWALTILMTHGSVEHGKFVDKSNCEKVGKQLVGTGRQMKFSCKLKTFKVK